MRKRIAIVESTPGKLSPLVDVLRSTSHEDWELVRVNSAAELGTTWCRSDLNGLVFVEWDSSTRSTIASLRAAEPDVPVVAVAQRGDVKVAAEAIGAGASDLLVLGDTLGERVATVLGKLRKVTELIERNRRLGEHNRLLLQGEEQRFALVGDSAALHAVLERVRRVAAIPRPVLILGERGTGKELVARAIHHAAGPSARPFLAVNCAALPDNLLESELFGYERGAFTGAERTTPGKFEQARHGTLFLDEIGHMSLAFQQKILRVVEYGTFLRLGGTREYESEARIIAATNTDIRAALSAGLFLPDLYDRLAFEVIELPPLRERPGDVELLARHFLDHFLREVPALGKKEISPEAIAMLESYAFPGNIRELKHWMERAAYRDDTSVITPEDLGLPLTPPGAKPHPETFQAQIAALERRLLGDALRAAEGNQTRAAELLGLEYHQFRYYHQKHFGDGKQGKSKPRRG